MHVGESGHRRRSVIKSAGALGAVLLAPKLPLWSLAEAAPSVPAPSLFVQASSTLLGIPTASLKPSQGEQDNLLMADVFYTLAVTAGSAGINGMLTAYQNLNPETPDNIKALALLAVDSSGSAPRTDAVGTFARLTMLAWLFGTWYGGTEIANNSKAAQAITNKDYQQDFIISGRAYKNGWIWRIAQAHPMGFSQFSFGSWASKPPTLQNYGVTA
ncbi:MAG: hypothetical protein ABWZ80_09965 [Beijerinckiaceae bacterium]